MNLYPGDGWFGAENVLTLPFYQIFVTGGRGIGKTFSTIRYLIEHEIRFIYLRRIDKEAYLSRIPESSEVGKVLDFLDIDFYVEKIPKTSFGYFRRSGDDSVICFVAANKTFENCRGMNFSWCDFVVYDEFIPKPSEQRFREEGQGLYHILETVGRNRELEGLEPVRLICLSNALNMQNDIFMEFDLLEPADELLHAEEECMSIGERLLIICKRSPISERKRGTALYRNASRSFIDLAIDNKFIYDDLSYVNRKNLKEYTAVCAVGPLFIYKHKNKSEWYCCFSKAEVKERYSTQSTGLELFNRRHWRFMARFLDGKVKFENYKAQTLFERFINHI